MLGSMALQRSKTRAPGRSTLGRRGSLVEALEARHLMSADAVLDWNDVAMAAQANDLTPSIVATPEQGGPTRAARAMAIVHAAIFDAVNSIDGSYTPYLVKQKFPKFASIDAAAAQAAHDTLVALYPAQRQMFDRELRESLSDIRNGLSEITGRAIGKFVARRILDARKNDGSQLNPTYIEGTAPGEHRVDPLNPNQGYLTPAWGSVKPFGRETMVDFMPPAPPELTSQEYAAAFQEVKDYGGDGVTTPTLRTAEQTEIGIFWGYDGRPGLGTPVRLYNQIARTVAADQHNTEIENARLFALLNMGQADAGCAAWMAKYEYNFWRPIVAIREADQGTGPSGLGDGNPATTGDPNWTPLGAPGSNGGPDFTPPFPAYTSGHATFGGVVFQTLANFYGRDDISFSFTSDEFNGITTDAQGNVRPVVTRRFDSFSEASAENAQSRIYLGVHWSFDATEGMNAGVAIANNLFDTLLKPRTVQPPGGGINIPKIREALSHVLNSGDVNAVLRALAKVDHLPARIERIVDRLVAQDDRAHAQPNRQISRPEQRQIAQTVHNLARELGLRRIAARAVLAAAFDEVFGRWAAGVLT